MCGRFAFYSPAEAAAALFGATGSVDLEPRYNIAPTQDVAAIRSDESGGRELVAFRWGLVPFWAKDPAIGNRMINARAETVAEKPAFRAAYRRRRCVVLADGFYEWYREETGKTPYYVSAGDEPVALAAIWERWTDESSRETLETTALITAAASDFMRRIHDRMPVILDAAHVDGWFSGDERALADAIDAPPALRAWPVSRRVNNARNEGGDLIEPAGEVLRA